jgi:phage tail sheath protein FI
VNLPANLIPVPVPVVVYEKGATIPSSATPGGLAGIASDLETAINNTLPALLIGSPIVITGATGVYQALGGSPGPGATDANADCDLTVNLLAGVPTGSAQVTVIANTTTIPNSVTALAAQLASTLNTALTGPGVTVVCTPIPNASLPADGFIVVSATATATGLPVSLSIAPPTAAGVHDAAAALGLEAATIPTVEVVCSVVSTSTGQAIEATAVAVDQADAAVGFTVYNPAPAIDAATALGLVGGGATTLAGPTSVNVAHYALGTNNPSMAETSSTPAVPMDGLPGADQLTGDPLAQTGIYALSKVAFNLLCIPDAVRASAGNPSVLDTNNTALDPVAVYSAAIAMCVQKRAMLLIDPPPTVTTVAAAVDWKSSTIGVVNANGAAFWPRLRLADPMNASQLRTFSPSGVVAGVYANTDTTRGVWKAPAGIGAVLNGVQNMTYQMTDAENGVLNPLGLNCFRTFPVYGPVLWGARTLLGADAEASEWKYVPIRRVALFIESSLYQGTQWVVFEPNDEPLWSSIRLNIGSFMQNLFIQGYFQGQTPAQAYFVKCDSETTTQTDIDNGVVNIVVGFAPLYPAEFVVIQIQQMTGQTTT